MEEQNPAGSREESKVVMTSTQKSSSRKTREQRTTTSTSNVFSRLTAPTKATIGKSKRENDKKMREEWRQTMNSQLEYEESLMNMGGFVLKEQRYKKIGGSRSPVSAKTKKRPTTAATTGNVKTWTEATTTRTVYRNGKKVTTTSRTSSNNQNQHHSASKSFKSSTGLVKRHTSEDMQVE